ncbi:MAG: MmgE/PrpD family protein, partial [Desulfobacterales bacterium]
MEETKEFVKRCFELNYSAFSDELIDRVKYLFLDYAGVAARGSLSDSSGPVHHLVMDFGKSEDGAAVVGTKMLAGPLYAAIANGTAAHSLELDDVVNEASLHPAVSIMSAALAAADISQCSGKKFIEAIVAGYQTTIKLGVSLNPSIHYAIGFHPTGTCGTMGAAIATAKILGLNLRAMVNALGIAGSMAAGSMEFLTGGAFTKRLHPGWAAHSGLMASLLAMKGFAGPDSIIEGKYGFLHMYSTGSDASKLLKNWGNPYEIMRTSIKPHACCRYKQGPIDCILKIIGENKLKPRDIKGVILGVLEAGFPIVAEPKELKISPGSVVDAQFSMPFGAAVAILYGKATLDEYTMEKISSIEVKEMMKRVSCVKDPEIEKSFPKRWPASATVVTKNGETYCARIDYPKGDPENPLT